MILNAQNWRKVEENGYGKRKASPREDRNIMTCAKKTPFISSAAIKNDLNLSMSTTTFRQRLIQAKSRARRSRKVTLSNKRQIQSRLLFAHEHAQWNERWCNVL
ncbi:hypothetical protein Trydic_g11782 [Trypoxylus dichotomus]